MCHLSAAANLSLGPQATDPPTHPPIQQVLYIVRTVLLVLLYVCLARLFDTEQAGPNQF
jgi:hypothetical protein